MSCDYDTLIRGLIPKSYHFDAYNELNYPNSRDRPFFEAGIVPIGNYYLDKSFDNTGALILQFSSICPKGKILFKPYRLMFEEYVKLLRKGLKEKSDFITFEIPIEYKDFSHNSKNFGEESDYSLMLSKKSDCSICHDKNGACKYFLNNAPRYAVAAVSFDIKDIKKALSLYLGIETNNHSSKGGNKMKNFKKMLGMNFEFGVSKDTSVAATFMGVAFKDASTGNYYVYDPKTNTRKNYAGMKFGDFRVFLLPDTTLQVDQLYKLEGKYYFVKEVANNTVTAVDPISGNVIQKILGECVIPGMNFYTRVVALDPRTMFDNTSGTDMSKNIITALLMTQWSKGESDFSLDNIDDDSFNGLGMLLLMGGNNGLSTMLNGEGGMNLPMILAMGNAFDSEESGGFMQYMLLNSILNGGNNNGMNNLFGNIPGITPAPAVEAVVSEDTVFCPNCSKEFPEGAKFCSECGAHTVPKGKHCTKCGAKLINGAAFCHICGKKAVADECPNCHTKIAQDAKFCSACGFNLKEDHISAPTRVAKPKAKRTATQKPKATAKPADTTAKTPTE